MKRTDISLRKQEEEDVAQRANLAEKLALRTEEAAQHERDFQQMAKLTPCGEMDSSNICRGRLTNLGRGMFTFDPEGTITWANPQCEFHRFVQNTECVVDLLKPALKPSL